MQQVYFRKYLIYLQKIGSLFSDNLPLIDPETIIYFNSAAFKKIFTTITRILEIAGGNGGVFWLETANLLIENCTFVNNQAFIGGVGYLWRHSLMDISNILINTSIFYINMAGPTSGVFQIGSFNELYGQISYCNFTGNKGKRKKSEISLNIFNL